MNPIQFTELIIRPTLKQIGLYSDAAENLMIGTALQESGLEFLRQFRGGPGLGVYQVEPATHEDVYKNFLAYRPELLEKVGALLIPTMSKHEQLIGNLYYSTAIARLVYYRRPEPLPAAHDLPGLAHYWKAHYNSESGKGTVDQFYKNYRRAIFV